METARAPLPKGQANVKAQGLLPWVRESCQHQPWQPPSLRTPGLDQSSLLFPLPFQKNISRRSDDFGTLYVQFINSGWHYRNCHKNNLIFLNLSVYGDSRGCVISQTEQLLNLYSQPFKWKQWASSCLWEPAFSNPSTKEQVFGKWKVIGSKIREPGIWQQNI